MTNKVKVNIEKGSEIRLLDPMRPEEVGAAMKDQKTQSTSGPDGISVRGFRRVGALDLTLIFSCLPILTDYHWLPFDSPLHENPSSAVEGCGGAESATEGVPRIGRLC